MTHTTKGSVTPFSHWMTKHLSLRMLLFPVFLTVSALLCLPLLRDLYSSCRGDWDYFFSLYEVASISVFEYHQFPLWNPYFGGGMPLIGNPQAGYLSPIFVLTALFGVVAGLKIAVWLHTFLGMWGMWLLCGHWGIKGPARCAAPVVFMFTSCWAFHLAEGHVVWLPAAFLPVLFLSFLKGLESRKWLLIAAVVESIMFYEGGTYILAFSLLFILVYVAFQSSATRCWRPLGAFLYINILAALLSAPKLLPVLEALVRSSRHTGSGGGISLRDFLLIFLDRSQSFNGSLHGFGWWEYGSYLGVVGVTLYIFSFSLYRKHKPLLCASLVLMIVSLGNFAEFAPWTLLHRLPLFSSFKVPTRSLIVFAFSAALLTGLSLESLQRTHENRAKIFVAILVLVMSVDLFSVSYRIFSEANQPSAMFSDELRPDTGANRENRGKLYRISPSATTGLLHSVPSVHEPFHQISVPIAQRNVHGAWSDQYLPLLLNRGVIDAYETFPFARNALPVTDKRYKGESYFMGRGAVELLQWTPNRLVFKVKALDRGFIVINQNFWAGWRATKGIVRPYNGLLSIECDKGEHTLSVYFLPTAFLVGVCLFAGTLGMLAIDRYRRRMNCN
ncbi:MAG: hypothetical protein EG828_05335 [Deltaproteobacteria bacterium]|nr:hypothetical protein [Deltaproteobacteria bacterium]